MSDSGTAPRRTGWRLRDFPAVFLSYDEPWADAHWRHLRARLPGAVRVHGVKGLDACHKAAAAAVPGDWVLTVDADTRIGPALADAQVPQALLTGDFRLDWPARNAVNGLWSGNGCVKLWPKALLQEMRTHEAAPDGSPSLDHDIAGIRPGRSAQVAMPERDAVTDPAQTAFHAFRAGLRETVFLRRMAEGAAARQGLPDWRDDPATARLIAIWCGIGRHAPFGRWQLYGARLGLALPDVLPDWRPEFVNDYARIAALWGVQVMPRYLRGSTADPGWDWGRLDDDLQLLAEGQGEAMAGFCPDRSRLAARLDLLSPAVSPSRMDQLGYRLQLRSGSAAGDDLAREMLEVAVALDHPAGSDNLGRLHARGRIAGADPRRAAWLFRAAMAMGNPNAAGHLAELGAEAGSEIPALLAQDLPLFHADAPGLAAALRDCDAPLCLILDSGVDPGPAFARHVPDPALVTGGRVLGYLGRCAVTGLPRPAGIRVAAPATLAVAPDRPADVTLPVVLGQLLPPADAADAVAAGMRLASEGPTPLLAALGRDAAFGDHWVLGCLLALAGTPPGKAELSALAALTGDALEGRLAVAADAAAKHCGKEIPLWTAAESRALKLMIPGVPGGSHWLWAADGLAGLGPHAAGQAAAMTRTALTLWGQLPGDG